MSGTASVPNAFASAVTATGAQIDANWSTLVAYINDPTNRNNYVADGGATNTVLLTFSPPVVGGYTTGLEITFKAANTNSGAVVVNANGLGNVNWVNPDGSNLVAGQMPVGSTQKGVYDGTRFIHLSNTYPASAAAVSATATIAAFVSPGRMVNHPGVAKASAFWIGTSTGTITALYSYNVGSIVKGGTGTYTVSLSTAFSDTNYVVVSFVGGATNFNLNSGARTTSQFTIVSVNTSGVATDAATMNFVAYGNQ